MSVADTWKLWSTCTIEPEVLHEAAQSAEFILRNKVRYEAAGLDLRIPFYIVGVIHMRESNFSFLTHLANGDPLWNSDGTALQTYHVPKGLGPFATWVDGAKAALKLKWKASNDWDLARALINLEGYNGFGYRKHGIRSPYIWNYTNYAEPGKFAKDGAFDEHLIDKQCGAAAALIGLKALGVDLNEIPY